MLSGGGPSLIACHVPYVELLACLLFFLQDNRGWHTTTQIQFNELRMFFFYIFKELLTQTTTTTKAPKQNKGEYAKRDDVATKPKIVTVCSFSRKNMPIPTLKQFTFSSQRTLHPYHNLLYRELYIPIVRENLASLATKERKLFKNAALQIKRCY